MPNGRSNRRLIVFDTNPCKRNNTDYFKDLQKELDMDFVKWAFYSFLKTVDATTNIPITSAYKEVRLINAPIHLEILWNWDFDGLICGLYLLDCEFECNIINPPASIVSTTDCDEITEDEELID